VASATEQLAASVAEIGAQMRRSQRAANEAAEMAEKADDQMIGLSAAAEKIGGIVGVIADIAARTNLLALNATIEAARAGEAGRGFSVVAQEVKSLAEQTAKATAEVGAQIASVQNSTQIAAGFIGHMAKTTEEVSGAAATVATSIDEQGLATREIAKSISEASIGSTHVASNIAGLISAARESSDASSNMLHSTSALSQQASELRVEVARFLQSVRAA
jgi:methyl-accepting chemotaxis protein